MRPGINISTTLGVYFAKCRVLHNMGTCNKVENDQVISVGPIVPIPM